MIKKIIPFILAFSLIATLTGCAGVSNPQGQEEGQLKVGFCPGPYSDLWKTAIAPALEEKGYRFSYVEFSDYVQPNKALANQEIDVNLFQHSAYLKNFSEQHNLELSLISEVPTVSMGIWSNTTASLGEVKDGAAVTIPNDETNQARGLRVLEASGLIRLKDGIDKATAQPGDISENPHNLKIIPTEAAQIPRTLDSADLAVANGNFAISAGLDPADSIYNEVLGEGYFNVIAVRTEDLEKQFAKDIQTVATGDTFKAIIEDSANGFSGFQKPKSW